jgi:hypothetical protein
MLAKPSAKASGQAQDRPRGWQARVDRGVAERIMAVVDQFGLGLYPSAGNTDP